MIAKPFNEIAASDIEGLLEGKVPEGTTLEYKSELPHEGESKKIPFLAEVSAFANTVGGDLIIGVTEDNGIIKSIDGVNIEDPDKEILRLDNAIRNGIEPRLPSINIKAIQLKTGPFVFIIRVPQSWSSPHRVVFNDHSKFYGRSSASKYPLDVTQLRAAFVRSEDISDRLQSFREKRITGLLTERLQTINLKKGGRLVLHLLPLAAFTGTSSNRIAPRTELSSSFSPLGTSGWNNRVNLDGLMTYSTDHERKTISYCQLFRSGIVEAVTVLAPHQQDDLVLPSLWYEREIMKSVKQYLAGLAKFDVEVPVFAALSLVGMKGYRLGVSQMFFSSGDLLDRDLILLPEVALDEYTSNLPEALHPIFDMVWNAFGFEKSYNYDEQGNWHEK